jgi:rhomboid protease GluP
MRPTSRFIAINVGVYAVMAYFSGSFLVLDERWAYRYGLYNQAFLNGAYYQLLTSLFFHFDLAHLGYNMVFLAIFGYRAEDIYGEKRFALLYISSGVAASILTFLYNTVNLAHFTQTVSAGASGAIFGTLGAVLIAQRNLYAGGVRTSALYAFIFFIMAQTTGFMAHLFGLIFGFAAGYVITWNWYPGGDQYGDEGGDVDFDEERWERIEKEAMEEIRRGR